MGKEVEQREPSAWPCESSCLLINRWLSNWVTAGRRPAPPPPSSPYFLLLPLLLGLLTLLLAALLVPLCSPCSPQLPEAPPPLRTPVREKKSGSGSLTGKLHLLPPSQSNLLKAPSWQCLGQEAIPAAALRENE